MAIAGKKSRVRVNGELVSFTDESMSSNDDQIYQIDDENKRVWCKDCQIVVYENGVPVTEDYVINRLIGTVVFDVVSSRGDITVDGQYHPMSVIGEAREYNYTIEASNEDSSVFGDEFIRRTQTLLDVNGSIGTLESDTFFQEILMDDLEVVIEIFSEFDSGVSVLIRSKLSSVEQSTTVDGLIETSFDFEGVNDVDNRVVSLI